MRVRGHGSQVLLLGVALLLASACGTGYSPEERRWICGSEDATPVEPAGNASGVFGLEVTFEGEPISQTPPVELWALDVLYTEHDQQVRVDGVVKCELPGEDPPYESWTFTSAWRLGGPISERTGIAGATGVGVPGMIAGLVEKQRSGGWAMLKSGTSELVVERFDPEARTFSAQGWVLADGGPGGGIGEQGKVHMDIDLTW